MTDEKDSQVETSTKPVKRKRSAYQPEISIGTIGQVDDGKSTLVESFTGRFPDTHSEELARGISIRLGYASCEFKSCSKCEPPGNYTMENKCPKCGARTKLLRRVSFVDAPGHEILMATMLTGAAIMDGAILVISATHDCPQPQTREHLSAISVLGVKNVVIAQNKIELVSPERAKENYEQIKEFIKGTIAEDAPIIPISAMHGANFDYLIQAIEEGMPTPERDATLSPRMAVARSFDVNRPGTEPNDLAGGVLGGSISQGQFSVGDKITLLPGLKRRQKGKLEFLPVETEITTIQIGDGRTVETAGPGGLVAIGTKLDPSMTRSDSLVGSVISLADKPKVMNKFTLKTNLLKKVVGLSTQSTVSPLYQNENLMLNVGTATTIGNVTDIGSKGLVEFVLRVPVASDPGARVAISRRIDNKHRLIGYGIVQ
ncbi:MAG: translation initiation factor IF-2 subunit gamma [Candidatus Heimdallarchaeota archaeon]|nr:translation initiation factor IF-2 subunit gamma [Candidatus Heimdallarchaeota archaeon]MCK5048241.1 translation initiation factor IF-2 subunit gamma [Candidatus Heimdallarchaeota archaeon]